MIAAPDTKLHTYTTYFIKGHETDPSVAVLALSSLASTHDIIMPVIDLPRRVRNTGVALLENNEASAKLTTANGGMFLRAQLDSVANHVTARSIGD